MKPYAFGIDIGGTAIKLGLFRTDGTLLEKWQISTRMEDHGRNVLPDALGEIRSCIERRALLWDSIEGVGIGVPGPVGEDGTVFQCVNLGWEVFNIPQAVKELEPRLRNIRAANDVNAAALGEVWRGGAKDRHSAFLVTLGTGIGGGLVMREKIVTGARGGTGEIGHFCVEPAEMEPCSCGRCGCLEQYCSAKGLLHQAQKVMGWEIVSAKEVCDAAKAGDTTALKLLDQLGRKLGWFLTSVAGTVDPEVFVIGGGLSNAGEILLDRIEGNYRNFAFHAFRNTPFVLAKLGNDAGIYGCIKMLLNEEES